MLRQDRNLWQDADAEPRRNRSLDAGEVGAGVGDVPGAPGCLDRVDHALAIEAALLGHHQRQRIAIIRGRMLAAGYPAQLLGPRRDAAALAGIALEEREIELAALERAPHLDTQAAADVETQPGA